MLALLAAGCGSNGPSAASSVMPPPPVAGDVGAGTVLRITGAETGHPVTDATVVVAGRPYSSDGDGHVVLDQGSAEGSPMDISSPATLDRRTLLRSSTTAFTLWPRTSATGLDEDYTRQLVYTWDKNAGAGASPLYRLAGGQAVLVPSAALMGDSRVVAAHQHAADEVNAAVGGAVRYSVAARAPAGAITIDTLLDPAEAGCKERVLAFTSIRLRSNGEIASARIVFCNEGATRDTTVVHEVGHTFGMGHSPDPGEIMHAFKMRGQPDGFGARESLVMRLMLQRRGGNRFPDDDRNVTTTREREVVIVCGRTSL
jgi:hypothetical protein